MIKYYNIDKEFKRIESDFLISVKNNLASGNFILGKNVKKFENKISTLIKSKYVIGVGNGTDALELAMLALNIGQNDEVITSPNSFVSSANSIINVGATPVFVDIDHTFNIDPEKIESKITKKTKAIMPVHLNGFSCCMKKINKIAKKYNLYVIEDAAQSILSKFGKNFTGTMGDIGCFSLHPTKNLGALGDAGFITTQKKKIFQKVKYLRNHGLKKFDSIALVGRNSRLDELQAIALNLKLKFLINDTIVKKNLAKIYYKDLHDLKEIKLPELSCCDKAVHVYHRFVIKCLKKRDLLYNYLIKEGVEVKIHYTKNIYKQLPIIKMIGKKEYPIAELLSKQILSLPINQFTTKNEIRRVCKLIKNFYN
jgi:UDP-2-acetamido-2-deoxy-ribo-hexuluronate aminotransferase